jgi:hypothetical protein
VYLDTKCHPREWIQKICRTVIRLNLYKSRLRMELVDIKYQIWSTHLFLGLLFSSILILTLYSSVIIGTKIAEITNPSLNTIEQLEKQGYDLICSCQVK